MSPLTGLGIEDLSRTMNMPFLTELRQNDFHDNE